MHEDIATQWRLDNAEHKKSIGAVQLDLLKHQQRHTGSGLVVYDSAA
jgi:hypothetical protein